MFYIYVFFNDGTRATIHCVRAGLGARVKRPMAASALVEKTKNIEHWESQTFVLHGD